MTHLYWGKDWDGQMVPVSSGVVVWEVAMTSLSCPILKEDYEDRFLW